MAHDGRVVRQADVLGVVLVVVALGGARLLVVDDEGALDVDLDIAGVQDLLDVALDGGAARSASVSSWVRGRRRISGRRGRWPAGGGGGGGGVSCRGVEVRSCRRQRHGCGLHSWLQLCPLAATAHTLRASGDVLVVSVRGGEGRAGQ